MEKRQQYKIESLPMLRKIPFAESLQQLHRHNMRVAEVCHQSREGVVAEYNQTKQKFKKETEPNIDAHVQTALGLEKEVSRILKAKHGQAKKKNLQNLVKLQRYLAEQRKTIIAKQNRMMEESCNRRENSLKIFSATFHHSRDRIHHMREREEKEMERSLLLQMANITKIKEANERKQELLQNTRQLLQQKNMNVLQIKERSKSRQDLKESASWKKLVKKYQTTAMNQTLLSFDAKKRIENKKKEDEKKMEKRAERRNVLAENRQKSVGQELKKEDQKIQKANVEKQKHANAVSVGIDAKRKQRVRQLKLNTSYIQEEEEKRAAGIIEKHHYCQLNLSAFKSEKERLLRQNFCQFMAFSMKR